MSLNPEQEFKENKENLGLQITEIWQRMLNFIYSITGILFMNFRFDNSNGNDFIREILERHFRGNYILTIDAPFDDNSGRRKNISVHAIVAANQLWNQEPTELLVVRIRSIEEQHGLSEVRIGWRPDYCVVFIKAFDDPQKPGRVVVYQAIAFGKKDDPNRRATGLNETRLDEKRLDEIWNTLRDDLRRIDEGGIYEYSVLGLGSRTEYSKYECDFFVTDSKSALKPEQQELKRKGVEDLSLPVKDWRDGTEQETQCAPNHSDTLGGLREFLSSAVEKLKTSFDSLLMRTVKIYASLRKILRKIQGDDLLGDDLLIDNSPITECIIKQLSKLYKDEQEIIKEFKELKAHPDEKFERLVIAAMLAVLTSISKNYPENQAWLPGNIQADSANIRFTLNEGKAGQSVTVAAFFSREKLNLPPLEFPRAY